MEGRDHRWWPHWRGAIAGGGVQSKVEGSDCWWRRVITGEEEPLLVEGSCLRWRGEFSCGGERQQELSLVEGGEELLLWRAAIAGGLEWSQVEGSCRRWRP